MENKGTERVLLFNFKDDSQLKAIRMALFLMQVPERMVRREEYGMPLRALALGEEPAPALSGKGRELEGQMMVFAGLKDEKLENLLAMLRANPACGKIPYKAILTETNQNWDAVTLFKELQKEYACQVQKERSDAAGH